MGTSITKPCPIDEKFQALSSWEIKDAKHLLNDYKDKDLDFGLDIAGLCELSQVDKQLAQHIIDKFGSANGIVNVLAFICGAILVSAGSVKDKAALAFDALDFDATGEVSMDEMIIIMLCCARGFCVLSGVGCIPDDEEIESISLQAYQELRKSNNEDITKTEFIDWIASFVPSEAHGGDSEDGIEAFLHRFGMVEPEQDDNTEKHSQEFSQTDQSVDVPEQHDQMCETIVRESTESQPTIKGNQSDTTPTESEQQQASQHLPSNESEAYDTTESILKAPDEQTTTEVESSAQVSSLPQDTSDQTNESITRMNLTEEQSPEASEANKDVMVESGEQTPCTNSKQETTELSITSEEQHPTTESGTSGTTFVDTETRKETDSELTIQATAREGN